jgi:hypothetical protein
MADIKPLVYFRGADDTFCLLCPIDQNEDISPFSSRQTIGTTIPYAMALS